MVNVRGKKGGKKVHSCSENVLEQHPTALLQQKKKNVDLHGMQTSAQPCHEHSSLV